ncbi:MAG: OsmC family protein [Jiangellaceae bacterium]
MATTALDESIARFSADSAAAQTTPAVTATLTNGRARLAGGPFNWEADLPPVVGGGNLAPSPTAYLLGALAGCAVAFIHDTLGPQLGVQLDDVSIEITIDSPDPSERIDALRHAWLERCPVYLALLNPTPVESSGPTERSSHKQANDLVAGGRDGGSGPGGHRGCHRHPGLGDRDAPVVARGSFPDRVDAAFTFRLDGKKKTVNVKNAAETVVQQIVLAPGGHTGWHTHPGHRGRGPGRGADRHPGQGPHLHRAHLHRWAGLHRPRTGQRTHREQPRRGKRRALGDLRRRPTGRQFPPRR